MSLLLSKKHLRVEIPITIDGTTILYDEKRHPVTKTVFLPFSAKRMVESNQAKKPTHLQAKITTVDGDIQEVKEKVAKIDPVLAENLRLKQELEDLKKGKNKGGRPKKTEIEESND